jgi:hypothetical protein
MEAKAVWTQISKKTFTIYREVQKGREISVPMTRTAAIIRRLKEPMEELPFSQDSLGSDGQHDQQDKIAAQELQPGTQEATAH